MNTQLRLGKCKKEGKRLIMFIHGTCYMITVEREILKGDAG